MSATTEATTTSTTEPETTTSTLVQPTVPDTETTRGDDGQVLGESVSSVGDPGAQRLPSTGAGGAGTVAILGGGLVAVGALLLAARRRLPAAD